MSNRSLRNAIDGKCRDCGGQEGGARYWRVHVSACPVTACPLWPVRPITSENPPPWLASREPGDLPAGFLSLSIGEAVALIRGAGAVFRAASGGNSATAACPVAEEGGEQ